MFYTLVVDRPKLKKLFVTVEKVKDEGEYYRHRAIKHAENGREMATLTGNFSRFPICE